MRGLRHSSSASSRQWVEAHGDPRRAPLAQREEAKAFSELELTSADPLTIVLSEKGWIRAAKGHDIDPVALSYKSGDGFRFAARGKSNLPTVVLDSTGRAYTLPTHQLPSARGQGEPLTGRINPPSGATFEGLLTGAEEDRFLLASDAGYGFVVQFGQLQAKNKAGKASTDVTQRGAGAGTRGDLFRGRAAGGCSHQ